MNTELEQLLALLGSRQSREFESYGERLRAAGRESLPSVLKDRYLSATDWHVRNDCVRYSTGYCRRSEAAVDLGKAAIFDKSKFVRYRAAELLACSLRLDAIKVLEKARERFDDAETRENISAAIDAIENQNHTYFWDKKHTGMFRVNFEAPKAE